MTIEYELSVDAAWRKIRAKRHQPPPNAFNNPRRLVFAAAMKQSEQFFRLSDQAGYETKPILLYYGLNQAARAIVAVGAPLDEPWQLNGHGLTCPGLNQVMSLGDLIVVNHGKDKSFQKLAEQMSSPTLPAKVEFRELWASLPEGAEVPLQGSDNLCTAIQLKVTTQQRGTYAPRYMSEVRGVWLHGLPRHDYSAEGTETLRKLLH
jgi:YaaC-like Protein